MSIRIFPEKVSNIKKHKTRAKLKDHTLDSKKLIKQASHILSSVEVANKEFKKIKLPYLENTNVVFYSPTKLVIQGNNSFIKTKVKELHDQYLEILKKRTFFSKLEELELDIKYQTQKDNKKIINKKAKDIIEKLKEEFK
ncbi:hypothetical protein [Francisella frigiditurris]|uniref:Uncharacterized protein n=1 Tax=Francisella frigiditurris TaxID=1542390 RepID=A0A1J0KRR9_9GAMM|nr:hypothetical protein [Francisella frigiditurris]APC96342.1 hypothetical protein KX01_1822 [Francisella frigiditurris]